MSKNKSNEQNQLEDLIVEIKGDDIFEPMTCKERVTQLRDVMGWNVTPMVKFAREENNDKVMLFPKGDRKHINKMFPVDNWDTKKHKNFAICMGELSNLMILDLDSAAAVKMIEDEMGVQDIKSLSNYVIKTYKGYQLFFKYSDEPLFKSDSQKKSNKINVLPGIDILVDGLSFADPFNAGYELINYSTELQEMPGKIHKLLTSTIQKNKTGEFSAVSDPLMMAIRENSDLPYKNPMVFTIRKLINNEKLFPEVKKELLNIFATKDFSSYKGKISEFAKPGQLYHSILYAGSLVAASPTVNKEMYKQFMINWCTKVAKIKDFYGSHEQQILKSRMKANMAYWRYDADWEAKAKAIEESPDNDLLNRFDVDYWYDIDTSKYNVYHKNEKVIGDYASWLACKEGIMSEVQSSSDINSKVSITDEVDFKKKLRQSLTIRRRRTFDVNTSEKLFVKENDRTGAKFNMFNEFSKTRMLELTDEMRYFFIENPNEVKNYKMPKYTTMVIDNVFPAAEEKELFLHNLAYHMSTLEVCKTFMLLTGVSGAGKGTLCDIIMPNLYDEYYVKKTENDIKSRFREDLIHKLVLFIDEVEEGTNNFNTKGENGSIHQILKMFVGTSTIGIEGKGTKNRIYNNNSFVILASNEKVPFKLSNEDDKRFNAIETNNVKLDKLPDYPKNYSTLAKYLNAETEDFVKYLATIVLSEEKYGEQLNNKTMGRIRLNSSNQKKVMEAAIENHDITLPSLNDELRGILHKLYRKGDRSILCDDFDAIFGADKNKYKSYLASIGVEKEGVGAEMAWVLNPKGHTEVDFEDISEGL